MQNSTETMQFPEQTPSESPSLGPSNPKRNPTIVISAVITFAVAIVMVISIIFKLILMSESESGSQRKEQENNQQQPKPVEGNLKVKLSFNDFDFKASGTIGDYLKYLRYHDCDLYQIVRNKNGSNDKIIIEDIDDFVGTKLANDESSIRIVAKYRDSSGSFLIVGYREAGQETYGDLSAFLNIRMGTTAPLVIDGYEMRPMITPYEDFNEAFAEYDINKVGNGTYIVRYKNYSIKAYFIDNPDKTGTMLWSLYVYKGTYLDDKDDNI